MVLAEGCGDLWGGRKGGGMGEEGIQMVDGVVVDCGRSVLRASGVLSREEQDTRVEIVVRRGAIG